MVRQVVDQVLGPLWESGRFDRTTLPQVLDPACGDGVFLRVAGEWLEAWLGERSPDTTRRGRGDAVGGALHGVDRDPGAVAEARRVLADRGFGAARLARGNSLVEPGPEVDTAWDPLDWEAAFGPVRMARGFDAVVGNPPFVDAEAMTRHAPKERRYLASTYQSLRGAWDLFCPFVERCASLLASGGRLGLILPNKVLGAGYAAGVRRLLADLGLCVVQDYTGVQVFRAAVYPVVVVAERSGAMAACRFERAIGPVDALRIEPVREVSAEGLAASAEAGWSEALWASPYGEAAAGSGDAAAGSGEAAAGSGEAAAGSGEAAAGSGDAAAGSGDAAAGSGEAAAGSGDAAAGSGDAAAGSGDAAAGSGEAAAGSGEAAAGSGDAAAGSGDAAEIPGAGAARRERAGCLLPLGELCEISGAATVSEAYRLQPLLGEEPAAHVSDGAGEPGAPAPVSEGTVPVVNTGTLDPHRLLWGRRAMRYLGRSYRHPTVALQALEREMPRRAAQARARKIIVAGMVRRLECVYDPGEVLAAKSTSLLLLPEGIAGERLGWFLTGLLNSRAASERYARQFGGLALSGGYLRVGPPQLRALLVVDPEAAPRGSVDQVVRGARALSRLAARGVDETDPRWTAVFARLDAVCVGLYAEARARQDPLADVPRSS